MRILYVVRGISKFIADSRSVIYGKRSDVTMKS
jgi:hypothetical protein